MGRVASQFGREVPNIGHGLSLSDVEESEFGVSLDDWDCESVSAMNMTRSGAM
jgi:hypothetical protein